MWGRRCDHEGCGKAFLTKDKLQVHWKSHGPKKYQCKLDGCTESFSHKYKLLRHQVSHTGIMPYRCTFPGCDKGFMLQSLLTFHAKKHFRTYVCDFRGCPQTFDAFSLLTAHRNTHKTLKCPKCNRLFATKEEVALCRKRDAVKHPTEMFSCPEEGCAKAYTTMFNVRPN